MFNFPSGEETIKVEDEKMKAFREAVNEKKIVSIGDKIINTAYFVKAQKIQETKRTRLPEAQLTDEQREQNLKTLRDMKRKLGL